MNSKTKTSKQNNITTGKEKEQQQAQEQTLRAHVDFLCLEADCQSIIGFNVMQLEDSGGIVSCEVCHRSYHFDQTFLDKLRRLRNLIFAIQGAADILGNVNVAIQTMSHEVKVPYNLLLTRMNSVITLEVGDRQVDFNFRIEPLNGGSIRDS